MVFIDELHFYQDAPQQISEWYMNNISVVGTTLNRGNESTRDFWTHQLEDLGVPV